MARTVIVLLAGALAVGPGPASARDPSLAEAEATQLLEEGRFLESLAAFEELTAEANPVPWRAKGYVRMGGILALFLDKNDEAEGMLRKAIALDPRGPIGADAYFRLGMILHEQGRYAEAAEAFEAFLAIDATSVNGPTAEFLLGQCRRLAERFPTPPPPPPVSNEVRLTDDRVRVAIAKDEPSLTLGCAGPWSCEASARQRRDLDPSTLTVRAEGLGMRVGPWSSDSDDLTFSPLGPQPLDVNGMRIPGTLRVVATRGRLMAINVVELEDYVRGVVPKEMPPSWPPRALEAQAVIARTYAVYHKLRRRDYPFDLLSTISSQVYGGATWDPRADSAVARTRGRILLYQCQPALTLFHASSGGHTESLERVWGSALPYLVAKEDPYSPPQEWTLTLTTEEVARSLSSCGENAQGLKRIEFVDKGPSGRFARVRIVRSHGEALVRSDRFRGCLGPGTMKSTRVRVWTKGGTMVLEGTGFGHGVGLSQWGARGMAERGASMEEILAFYYPGTTLGRLVTGRG